MDDLRISVRIWHDAKEKRYQLVDRRKINDNSSFDQTQNASTNLVTETDTHPHSEKDQKLNEEGHDEISSENQKQSFQIKCEPQETIPNLHEENHFGLNKNQMKTIKLSVQGQKEGESKSNSTSPVLTTPSLFKPINSNVKQEIISSHIYDPINPEHSLETPSQKHHLVPEHEKHFVQHAKDNQGVKRFKCKSESAEDSHSLSHSVIEDRLLGKTIKVEPNVALSEPNVAPSEHQLVNLKQEPPEEYDINVDISSPLTTSRYDDPMSPIAEQEEEDATMANISDEWRGKDGINNDRISQVNSLDTSKTDVLNFDAITENSLSEFSQDDTSSTIGPTINVISCNEDPSSGCSYTTSSLSSYQVIQNVFITFL